PNSEGLVNPLRPLVATFSPVFHDPQQPLLPQSKKAKPIAVSCQSGALTFAFLSRGRDRQLQFTYQVSAGNQTVLEAHDYVDWVLDAGGADIFMCYLEGIRYPARFRAVADQAAHGLELPVLEDDLQARIMALLPSYGSAQNPIDATAQAIGEVGYARIVEIVRQSERIDTILLISSMANETRAKKVADEMAELV